MAYTATHWSTTPEIGGMEVVVRRLTFGFWLFPKKDKRVVASTQRASHRPSSKISTPYQSEQSEQYE